ncbi:MAG: hypothetical protein LQ351_007930 [Letrouitia transgressa]|nr:MAG: hypothetical protein LQ351_007930 [Letrouitia transgressa]
MVTKVVEQPSESVAQYEQHAANLSLLPQDSDDPRADATTAVKAKFITPRDPVIETADGGRLPAVPIAEAEKLNRLKDEAEQQGSRGGHHAVIQKAKALEERQESNEGSLSGQMSGQSTNAEAPLRTAIPPSRTHPLFPQLPLYGPPTLLRNLQSLGFRLSSAVLSVAFLGVIVLGSLFTSILPLLKYMALRLRGTDPNKKRPFYMQEVQSRRAREDAARAWKRNKRQRNSWSRAENDNENLAETAKEFEPTEGGKDPLICDVSYYARRVGLDCEEFKVQTEDGFIIRLLHIFSSKEYTPSSPSHRDQKQPVVFPFSDSHGINSMQPSPTTSDGKHRYPVLLIHGLLQSAGAYCANDDSSLAFYLCKSGYDVWVGNNRCGFSPEHQTLDYTDPRTWNWNIRQMGVMDLPALVSRVLSETSFEKIALVAHSQGTTETFVALAKEQRPDLGKRISVFCALAPAVYAGPLIGKMYFKFMRVISPAMFRIIFGIHAFIPFMMTMHAWLPGKIYGALGYRVFSFLFNWSDDRWDRGLRDRFFQFAPVYVSAESMRWWLGRECFATQKCILATREEGRREEEEDEGNVEGRRYYEEGASHPSEESESGEDSGAWRGNNAWYDEQMPPLALWIGGSDELVDGRRLLRRFERGREPNVRIVHQKVIEEYEHLDVIWAMDCIDQVGREIREVIWRTVPSEMRDICRTPRGCESLDKWEDPGPRRS